MKKLFLICALISPNPEKSVHMSNRNIVETGDMVCYPSTGNWAGLCKAGNNSSAGQSTGLIILYRAVSLSNKQKTVAWLEVMVPDLYLSQQEDSCSSAFQVVPCTNICMKNV